MHTDCLNELRQLIDFGLVVLLWLVQWIIYPSFLQVAPERLVDWHANYTQRMGYIVAPMMFGQLGLSVLAVWQVGVGLDWLDLLGADFRFFGPAAPTNCSRRERSEGLAAIGCYELASHAGLDFYFRVGVLAVSTMLMGPKRNRGITLSLGSTLWIG
jgi:hypothetical protein